MKNCPFLILVLILSVFCTISLRAQPHPEKNEKSILDYGAKNDGRFLNTKAIQNAIDDLHRQGGGRLIFPKGIYHTGSITLKTGVSLRLDYGAVILGSINPHDYVSGNKFLHFINAENANHIGITGEGIIDARGRKLALVIDSLFHAGKWDDPGYNHRRHRPGRRPKLLSFRECSHINIEGITVKNSASWVLSFDRCTDMTIDRVSVDSDHYWNNDGMDITDCRNVRITHCYVNSADDGICLKSEHKGVYNDSIYIAHCTVRSSASAIKFGTASVGGFKNVKIEDIHIFDTFRSAIALESVDGGILENIEISDITAINTGNAIFIKLGHRNEGGAVGTLKNVKIKNVVVQVPYEVPDLKYQIRGPELPFFHNIFPASITGLPGHDVENVSLENIRIIYPGRANKGYAYLPLHRLKDIPENESGYPEFSMFGELPSWGIYVRHVKGLTMKDINLKVLETDFRPALVFDDVSDLSMEKVQIYPTHNTDQIVLRNVGNKKIQKIYVEGLAGDMIKTLDP